MHSIVVRKMVLSNSHIKINIFFKKKVGNNVQMWMVLRAIFSFTVRKGLFNKVREHFLF